MRRIVAIISLFCLLPFLSTGQSPLDKVIAVEVVTNADVPSIRLSWPTVANAQYTLRKRVKGTTTWNNLFNNATITNFTDEAVSIGVCYEYGLIRSGTPAQANAYLLAGIDLPVVDHRGKILLIADETLSPIWDKVMRLNNDIMGDGWTVELIGVNPDSVSVSTIKTAIVNAYNAAPSQVKAVFLLGRIPVPYSGNICPDGHSEHCGAWPADAYYGDVNGNWTDNLVNTTSAARPENRNIPGDGKFDQSTIPSQLELQVGRVDFTRLNPATFGESNLLALYERYLDKNHAFRQTHYRPLQRMLVDDNFGYFNGESFASNGWKAGYNLFGANNTTAGDFQLDTDTDPILMAYGCGGGSYQSAGGVGTTASFAADSIKVVFSMLFGSYHGDWDSDNNFMMGALANKGGILSCSWSGRPNWYYHHLGMGENIGLSAGITINNGLSGHYADGGFGNGMIHVALLGDPTLRLSYPSPPDQLNVTANCSNNLLQWQAATDTSLTGYHVYRLAGTPGASWERISFSPTADTSFSDDSPVLSARYMVRAVTLQQSLSGTYYNQSTGAISPMIVRPEPLEITIAATDETGPGAYDGSATASVSGGVAPYELWWSNNQTGDTITGLGPGSYSLVVTDAQGCTSNASVTISTIVGTGEPALPLVASIFPNPASAGAPAYLKYQTDRAGLEGRLSIYNATGQSRWEIPWHGTEMQGLTLLPIENIPPGVYWISLFLPEYGRMTWKWIIGKD